MFTTFLRSLARPQRPELLENLDFELQKIKTQTCYFHGRHFVHGLSSSRPDRRKCRLVHPHYSFFATVRLLADVAFIEFYFFTIAFSLFHFS